MIHKYLFAKSRAITFTKPHIYTMADTALISALSAVGGALIGATAAVTGPLLLQRRNQKQQEKQAARETKDGAISRIVNMRTSIRMWAEVLEDAHHDLEHGNTPDRTRFEEAAWSARRDASEAIDSALHDGLWIAGVAGLSYEDMDLTPDRPQPGYGYWWPGTGWGATNDEHIPIIGALAHTTRLIRDCIHSGGITDDETRENLNEAFSRVASARTRLNANLISRIESIENSTPLVHLTHVSSPDYGYPRPPGPNY